MRRGREHAEGAGELGRLVGEDVAEQVVRQDDVELPGVLDQLHGRVVRQHMLEARRRETRDACRAVTTCAPEETRLHHVRLLGRR